MKKAKQKKIELFLVPGFMGFSKIGGIEYFEGVKAFLEEASTSKCGCTLRVHSTATLPAGALTKRAETLALEIARLHEPDTDEVHLLGHSTGGLDIRLLLSPGSPFDIDRCGELSVFAEDGGSAENYADALSKVRSAMSLATPHGGTRAANLLLQLSGDRALEALGRFAGNRVVQKLGSAAHAALSRMPDLLRPRRDPELLEWLREAIAKASSAAIFEYATSFGEDVGALVNLEPATTALFNATVRDRDGVYYGSFVTGTNAPSGLVRADDPAVLLSTILFRRTWRLLAEPDRAYPAPKAALESMRRVYDADRTSGEPVGELAIGLETNDGVVPSWSQVYRNVEAVVSSDHLDCVGMYPHAEFPGWVDSGADFRRDRFEFLWGRVADVICEATERMKKTKTRPTADAVEGPRATPPGE